MSNNSRETVFERHYEKLGQQISEYARTESIDSDNFFAKLKALKGQQAKIAEIFEKQKQEEEKFSEERRHELFGNDLVYQKAKELGNNQLLEKFHTRSLTEDEYQEAAEQFGVDLGIDYYYGLESRYDYVSAFSEGFARVTKDGKWFVINEKGQKCFGPYDYIDAFSEGFASVKKDGKYFFINTKGEICFGPYDEVYTFSEGFAKVKKNEEWFFINTKGEECFKGYDYVSDFSEGFAKVKKDGKWFFINTKG
ncbi:MAG: hypothetical protein DLD55_05555, partial [candidate division SR1 bacterium]